MKSIHLEMIRVTEAAAIAASKFVGRGDKYHADEAATDAMRSRLNKIDFAGRIVIGEGEKDEAPGLFNGEYVGKLRSKFQEAAASAGEMLNHESQRIPCFDIATDPIEGTTPTSKGGYEAISVMCMADEGCLADVNDTFYMYKLVVGPEIAERVDVSLLDSPSRTAKLVATALRKKVSYVTVCVLDRPRHEDLIKELREVGCRIKLIQDCDVTGAIATCLPDSGIDIMMGIGGSPEGVIAAAALKCLGGIIQGQLYNKDFTPAKGKYYTTENLVKSDCIFCATGITPGSILKGVRYIANKPVTNSVLMRSESGTIRFIESHHGN